MKNTIKAKFGYVVKKSKTKENMCYVYDGNNILMLAELKTLNDYKDEVINKNNECAVKCEIFTTIKNNQFIYWRDEEIDKDYITKL